MSAVVADSRLATPGSLFVALRGSRVDGHDYLGDARRRGAVAALCEPGRGRPMNGLTVIEVESPLAAMGRIAAGVRRSSSATVVGIAGSAGKTSTKDILRALCAPHASTLASAESHNNELGVPLTLLCLEPSTRVAVCELGTGAPGELAGLCRVAAPDIGILTCVGEEHLASFRTVAAVAREEAELIRSLPPGGTIVLPSRAPLLEPYLRADLRTIRFGADPRADVRLLGRRGGGVELVVLGAPMRLRTSLRAPHQLSNLCAAVGAYAALGLPLAGVEAGAAAIELSRWRDEERRTAGGAVVINDSYNANPMSMRAALLALAGRRNGGRTIAVLGEMAELGPDARAWHRRIGRLADATGVDLLVAVGPLARDYGSDACWFADAEAAADGLPKLVRAGDVVLVKASRTAGLERVAAAIP